MNGVGAALKRFREVRGLTQREQAASIGMTPQQLSDIEAGRRDPRLSTLKRLAKLYGVTLAELVDPDNAKGSEE